MTDQKKTEKASNTLSHYLSTEYCYAMIAENAYYRAEKRGFQPGQDLADWYAAEQEINAQNFYKFLT